MYFVLHEAPTPWAIGNDCTGSPIGHRCGKQPGTSDASSLEGATQAAWKERRKQPGRSDATSLEGTTQAARKERRKQPGRSDASSRTVMLHTGAGGGASLEQAAQMQPPPPSRNPLHNTCLAISFFAVHAKVALNSTSHATLGVWWSFLPRRPRLR
eukprot:366017-Chlamydomonas_euryale.AAC.9